MQRTLAANSVGGLLVTIGISIAISLMLPNATAQPPQQKGAFHVTGQALPATLTTPAVLEGGTTNTNVNLSTLVLVNTDTAAHTVTIEDCQATPFVFFPAVTIPAVGSANSSWVIPMYGTRFTGCFKWSASSALVFGSVVGTR
jgi:hypothetical protein